MILNKLINGPVTGAALVAGMLCAPTAWVQAAEETTANEKVVVSPTEVPEHIHGDIVYGSPDAPVELIEYASMTCPHCKTFNDTVVPFLMEDLIPSGKVKLIFRNFVRDSADLAVAVLSRCTIDEEQSKRLIKAYFERQDEWTRAPNPGIAIQSIANSNGVPFANLQECVKSQPLAEHLIEMRQMAIRLYQINSVPTILINGTKVQFTNFEDLKDKIALAVVGK